MVDNEDNFFLLCLDSNYHSWFKTELMSEKSRGWHNAFNLK